MAWEKETWKGETGTGLNEFLVDGEKKTISANMNANATPISAEAMNDLEDRIDDVVTGGEEFDKKTWYESISKGADGKYSIILDGVSKKMKITFTGENVGITATKMNEIEDWLDGFLGKDNIDVPPTAPTAPTIESIFIDEEPVTVVYDPTTETQEGDNLYTALASILTRVYGYEGSSLTVTVTEKVEEVDTPVEGATVTLTLGTVTKEETTGEDGTATFSNIKAGEWTVNATYGDKEKEVEKIVYFNNAETLSIDLDATEE